MSMNKIFNDPRIDFIVENYAKVMELEECLEYTRDNISNRLLEKLRKLLEVWGYNYSLEIGKDKTGEYITWAESEYYDLDELIGLYYGIQIDHGWETLAGKEDYPAYLCILENRAEGRRKNSQKINAWIAKAHNTVKANRKKLLSKGINVVSSQENWGNCLVVIYLKELSLDSLSSSPFDEIELSIKSKIKLLKDTLTGEKGLIKPYF